MTGTNDTAVTASATNHNSVTSNAVTTTINVQLGACSDFTNRNECRADPTCEWVGGKKGVCQDVVVGQCTDNDQDGYGNPGDASCPNGAATDCDDNDPAVNPGATEGPFDDQTCFDGLDNDCDGLTDLVSGFEDPDCQEQQDCSTNGDKTSCRDAGCKWVNKDKLCVNP